MPNFYVRGTHENGTTVHQPFPGERFSAADPAAAIAAYLSAHPATPLNAKIGVWDETPGGAGATWYTIGAPTPTAPPTYT